MECQIVHSQRVGGATVGQRVDVVVATGATSATVGASADALRTVRCPQGSGHHAGEVVHDGLRTGGATHMDHHQTIGIDHGYSS
ncbi:MAG TPA: hypothetical protein VK694_07855 [Verrucomicrobiae bacterium]|nr:hypothetical protein [Verrucomicrobiae bacterium]